MEIWRLPTSLTMVFGHEFVKPLTCQRCGGIVRKWRIEEAFRQGVLILRPACQQIDLSLR